MVGHDPAFALMTIPAPFLILTASASILADAPNPPPQASKDAPNLIPNSSFEEVEGSTPKGWQPQTYSGEAVWTLLDKPELAHSGRRCLHVQSKDGSDSGFLIQVTVKPRTKYRLSGWIKTNDLRDANGALVNVHQSGDKTPNVVGTADWVEVHSIFDSGDRTSLGINALFGGWGRSKGEAWFDDIALREVAPK